MRLKEKSWIWKLSFPFAHNNYTMNPINGTLYYPKGNLPSERTIEHEKIHERQANRVGRWRFVLLYLFWLPVWKNRFRWDAEMEAYVLGSKITKDQAAKILRSAAYGWLRN